jgi:hypothetical protein
MTKEQVLERQEGGLWSVALQALVQAKDTECVHTLEGLRASGALKPEIEDYVVQALLSLDHRLPTFAAYFIKALAEERGMAVSNLAALVKADPRECIALASDYFASRVNLGRQPEVEANLPPFVEELPPRGRPIARDAS